MLGLTTVTSLLAAIIGYYMLRMELKLPWWLNADEEIQPKIKNRLMGFIAGLVLASWLGVAADVGVSWLIIFALAVVLICQGVMAAVVFWLIDIRKQIDVKMREDGLSFMQALSAL